MALAIVGAWDEQLGGVSAAQVRELLHKLQSAPDRGLKCGSCKSCRAIYRKRCATVAAILTSALPDRLKWALPSVSRSLPGPSAPAANAPSQPERQQQGSADGAAEDALLSEPEPGSNSDESDAEEDARWLPWAQLSGPPPQAGQSGQQRGGPKRDRNGAQRVAQGLGVDVQELTDWTCWAWLPHSGSAEPDQCGHYNSTALYCCERCRTPRWHGPVGQMRARVAAALQTGALAAGGELDSDEAGQFVAARLQWESAQLPNDHAADEDGRAHAEPAQLQQQVTQEQRAVVELMQRNASPHRGTAQGVQLPLPPHLRAACKTAHRSSLGKVSVFLNHSRRTPADKEADTRAYQSITSDRFLVFDALAGTDTVGVCSGRTGRGSGRSPVTSAGPGSSFVTSAAAAAAAVRCPWRSFWSRCHTSTPSPTPASTWRRASNGIFKVLPGDARCAAALPGAWG